MNRSHGVCPDPVKQLVTVVSPSKESNKSNSCHSYYHSLDVIKMFDLVRRRPQGLPRPLTGRNLLRVILSIRSSHAEPSGKGLGEVAAHDVGSYSGQIFS